MREPPERRRGEAEVTWQSSNFYTRLDLSDEAGHSSSRRDVGRERVIASTDCGLGGRVHPQIAWAKLETLAQGAALATRQLWR